MRASFFERLARYRTIHAIACPQMTPNFPGAGRRGGGGMRLRLGTRSSDGFGRKNFLAKEIRAALGGHWMHILYRFPEALHVAEGDLIRLSARHDRMHLSIDFVEHVRG